MMDFRIINHSRSLKDLESGEAAKRFYGLLSSLHKDIRLDDSSNLDCWKLLDNRTDGSVWIFENMVHVKLDTPPFDRGYHRFVRLRSIMIEREKRGFSLSVVRRCIRSLLEYLEAKSYPLFLVVKPFEETEDGKEIYSHKPHRQKALLDLFLDLGFKLMDQDSWNIACEGSTRPFKRRNKNYPLEIPFLIKMPSEMEQESKDYFDSFVMRITID